ncbi:hypothetical protein HEP87_62450 [Streptomyces sp. S1D4-11]
MPLPRVGERPENEAGDMVRRGGRMPAEQGEDMGVGVGEDTPRPVRVGGRRVEGVGGEPMRHGDPVQALPGDRAAPPGPRAQHSPRPGGSRTRQQHNGTGAAYRRGRGRLVPRNGQRPQQPRRRVERHVGTLRAHRLGHQQTVGVGELDPQPGRPVAQRTHRGVSPGDQVVEQQPQRPVTVRREVLVGGGVRRGHLLGEGVERGQQHPGEGEGVRGGEPGRAGRDLVGEDGRRHPVGPQHRLHGPPVRRAGRGDASQAPQVRRFEGAVGDPQVEQPLQAPGRDGPYLRQPLSSSAAYTGTCSWIAETIAATTRGSATISCRTCSLAATG